MGQDSYYSPGMSVQNTTVSSSLAILMYLVRVW